jgi:hypothetical protein
MCVVSKYTFQMTSMVLGDSTLKSLTPSVNTPLFLFKTFVWGGGGVFLKKSIIWYWKVCWSFPQNYIKKVECTLEKNFFQNLPKYFCE